MDHKARNKIQAIIAQAANTTNKRIVKIVHIKGGKWIALLALLLFLTAGLLLHALENQTVVFELPPWFEPVEDHTDKPLIPRK